MSFLQNFLQAQNISTALHQFLKLLLIKPTNLNNFYQFLTLLLIRPHNLNGILSISSTPTYSNKISLHILINFLHSYFSNQNLLTVFNNFWQLYSSDQKILTVFFCQNLQPYLSDQRTLEHFLSMSYNPNYLNKKHLQLFINFLNSYLWNPGISAGFIYFTQPYLSDNKI